MSDYTDYIHLLTIIEPEEIVFKFNGTLGRFFLNWLVGKWIVTNRRLIFIWGNASIGGTTYSNHFGRRPVYVFLFEEFNEIIKKKKNIIIKYNTSPPSFNFREIKELRIGFTNRNYTYFQNSQVSFIYERINRR